ncbi:MULTISPECIES: hypothetical protein [unclassified Mesorhizobium]|uniref:hypothetical protein n=1 Tax=unclassified Mesorhizobium TaxID=325217 RepID=UPI0013DF06FC|nr:MULTISPECIES: hypothetical protein [unclassified Mesorhizobium]MCT2581124.1 hypothetical protein [Mesorhizobium sp. P13.3]MDF3170116.1 hypothetical protein [Mesorhizobium sp. P16.1]MDF3181433.1 hypothetical protein [Mesorhizobium sp. P17.1]MDF3187036.1 hypothetical protein [Mesorhizobium sp. ICCV3110.1]
MPVLPPCLLQSRFASLAAWGNFQKRQQVLFPGRWQGNKAKANTDAKHFLDSKSNAHA